MNEKKTIGVFTSHADYINTGGKNAWLGRWLQQAGYEVMMLCWDEPNATNFTTHKLPYMRLMVEQKPGDLFAAAMELEALLDIPLVTGTQTTPPTLGRLMAFDDFLGCGKRWSLNGADAVRFDCLVSTMLPSELTVAEDAVLGLQLWRYTTNNHIPHIGIECSSLDNDTRLSQWPVDMLLTKKDPRVAHSLPPALIVDPSKLDIAEFEPMAPGRVIQLREPEPSSLTWPTHPTYAALAPEVYQMDRACRYALSLHTEPALEELYANHKTMLKEQFAAYGERYLYLPFHLSYKERTLTLLHNLAPYREVLMDAGFALVLSCDSRQHRRLLTEQDMVNTGMLPWLNPWRRGERKCFAVVEGMPMLWLMDMASAVLAPCESLATEWARHWDIPIIKAGNEEQIGDLSLGVSVVEAVRWMLDPERAQQEQAA